MPPLPSKRRKLDLSEEFKVVVGVTGETQQTFTVAKQVLTKSSNFFRKACNGDWKEKKTRTIKLLEAAPDVFSIYLQWLYTGELIISDQLAPSKSENKKSRSAFDREQYTGGINVYIFADSILDDQLQNSAMDFMREALVGCANSPGVSQICQAVKGTMPGCHLRRFLVDSLILSAGVELIKNEGERIPSEFLVELLAGFATARDSRKASPHWTSPERTPKCHYHIHNDEAPICK